VRIRTCDDCHWHRTFYDDEGVDWLRPGRRFLSSVGPDGCSCEHPGGREEDHVCTFAGTAGWPEATQGTTCRLWDPEQRSPVG